MVEESERQEEGIGPEASHSSPVATDPAQDPQAPEEHEEQSPAESGDEPEASRETAAEEAEALQEAGPMVQEPELTGETVEGLDEEAETPVGATAEGEADPESGEEAATVDPEAVEGEEAPGPESTTEGAEAEEEDLPGEESPGEVAAETGLEGAAIAEEEPDEGAAKGEGAAEDSEAAELTEEPSAEQEEAEEEDDRLWYVIHCYSGQENKVRHNLEQRIETMGMKDQIFDVVVPTEEEIEVKDGKRRTVERRVFPGYILVQMVLTEDSWYVVRNTPGVTGFVGMGNEPTPLRPEEVSQIIKRMEAEAPRIKVTYKLGQKVRIIDGPFNDFIGTVDDIDMERAKVRVMVSFFGRETPVELDFLQVEKA